MRSLSLKLSLLVSSCAGLSGIACSGTDTGTVAGSSGGAVGAGGAGGTPSGGAAQTGGLPGLGGSPATGGIPGAGGAGGNASTGGANATGGTTTTTGGTANAGGTPATGGSKSTGGTTTAGGTAATGGSKLTGGTSATGGSKATGGTSAATGGTKATGGNAATGGAPGTGGATSTGACGSTTLNEHPFGCNFAWGIATPGGSLSGYTYLQFMSAWAGSNITAAGTFPSFNNSSWLTSLASTNIIPAYYAYIIGYYGHANNLPDQNSNPNGANLATGGAALITANYSKIIAAYTWYAQQTYAVWKTKPLVWLLEGDFVQYTATSQGAPLSYTELGTLAHDITCAIKANMPNAVVAIDHSGWNADAVTNSYWAAMAVANYDMVWTTGLGDNNGFITSGTTASSYNGATATYAYLHSLTGKTILVDTSAGASSAGDSWSTAGDTNLDSRISEGVIAANITGTPPSNLQSNITALSLNALPSCP